jgi:hypothetical protein
LLKYRKFLSEHDENLSESYMGRTPPPERLDRDTAYIHLTPPKLGDHYTTVGFTIKTDIVALAQKKTL